MLGSPAPAAATQQTTTTPASPTRPSRLRGLSYLRTYTQNHLHIPGAGSSHAHSNSRSTTPQDNPTPQILRSASTPGIAVADPVRSPPPPPTSNTTQPTTHPVPSGRRRATEAASTARPIAALINNREQDNEEEVEQEEEEEEEEEEQRISAGENGWVPTVQGRSGLRRDSLNPTSTSTENVSASISESRSGSASAGMTRNRALGPTPAGDISGSNIAGDTLTPSGFDNSSTPAHANGSDGSAGRSNQQTPTIRFIPHIETRSTRPSLNFTALTRTLKTPTSIVKVGRYSERDSSNAHSTTSDDTTVPVVGFKSKVVSRRHCEFWCTNGQWYVKDVKSSSGTFLNHVRLSAPGQESRPYPVNDGDVVQLGIDFKGGEEMIFRCVKIRIECNRGWQKRRNEFNTSTHRKLLKQQQPKPKPGRDSDAASVNTSECSICLNVVAPCQALFVAPCSHVWHYKCIRGLIHSPNYPNFLCPNCRFVADLEADVEQPEGDELAEDEEVDDEEYQRVLEQSEKQEAEDAGGAVEARTNSSALAHVESRTSARPSRASSRRRGGGGGTGDANIPDDELASLLGAANLNDTAPSALTTSTSIPQTATATAAEETSPTPNIPIRSTSSITTNPSPSSQSNTAPTSHPTSTSYGVTPHTDMIGPMTPRNDAGPFVFDGSGSASTTRGVDGIVQSAVVEEEGSRTSDDDSSQGAAATVHHGLGLANGKLRRHPAHGHTNGIVETSDGTADGLTTDDEDEDVFDPSDSRLRRAKGGNAEISRRRDQQTAAVEGASVPDLSS